MYLNFLQRSQFVKLLTCCFQQVIRAMFITPLPTPHPQHQIFVCGIKHVFNSNERYHPTPDVQATSQWHSIKHVSNSVQQQRTLSSHPNPPKPCRSMDHVETCKQHHSGIASSMCSTATNVIIPPHPSHAVALYRRASNITVA